MPLGAHMSRSINSFVLEDPGKSGSNNYHLKASVNEMLQVLGWTSLELRRTMTCLNLLYKMSGGQIDIDVNSWELLL